MELVEFHSFRVFRESRRKSSRTDDLPIIAGYADEYAVRMIVLRLIYELPNGNTAATFSLGENSIFTKIGEENQVMITEINCL